MNKQLLAAVALGVFGLPSFADGIDIPKTIGATLGGDYVLRTQLYTNAAVTDLQVDVFHITDDGRVGDAVEGAEVRPKRNNTRAGQKKRVLVRIPGESVNGEQKLAVCMWRDPEVLNDTGSSAMVSVFRYCKLFTAKP